MLAGGVEGGDALRAGKDILRALAIRRDFIALAEEGGGAGSGDLLDAAAIAVVDKARGDIRRCRRW